MKGENKNIRKILIANRGEIAARIIRTLDRLQITSVVIYSDQDKESLFVKMADEKYHLKGSDISQTYLNIQKVIKTAVDSGCDAVHPGYGFLAENPAFAEECKKNKLIFIGPSPGIIKLMGDKLQAGLHVASLGIHVIPRVIFKGEDNTGTLESTRFPVMVKAVAGGGGKGIRRIDSPEELQQAVAGVRREAMAYFGDDRIYLERHLEDVRHIEVQILGDGNGNAIHLYERECTIQRRNQKIIEEAPSPTLSSEQRQQVCEMAVQIARSVKYEGAGTIEFLLHRNHDFYFLEMNTRIQVEHTVTEMISGRDLIADQIFIAQQKELPLGQHEASCSGHSIQTRIYAEDPGNDFNPSPGNILGYIEPMGNDIRIDSEQNSSRNISADFDPMIGKLIVHAEDRGKAIEKAIMALEKYVILGITTNQQYLISILNHSEFKNNNLSTAYIPCFHRELLENTERKINEIPKIIPLAMYCTGVMHQKPLKTNPGGYNYVTRNIGHWRQQTFFNLKYADEDYRILLKFYPDNFNIYINKDVYVFSKVKVKPDTICLTYNEKEYKAVYHIDAGLHLQCSIKGSNYQVHNTISAFERPVKNSAEGTRQKERSVDIFSPMHGKVIHAQVKEMQKVKKGDILLVIEAMKMENNILAPTDGRVVQLNVSKGSQVEKDMLLIVLQ